MAVRKVKPTTPGQRSKVAGSFEDVTTNVPEKSLLGSKKRSGGRNNTGKMTVRNIGGGHKKRYRVIDFLRNKDGVPGNIKSIEYDPNRSARIALVYYSDGDAGAKKTPGARGGEKGGAAQGARRGRDG